MSSNSKKIQFWMKFHPEILVEAMTLDSEMFRGMKKIAIEARLSELLEEADTEFPTTEFLSRYGDTICEYCLILENTSKKGYCAFDFGEEIGELLRDGIDVEEIILVEPKEYLERMGWEQRSEVEENDGTGETDGASAL